MGRGRWQGHPRCAFPVRQPLFESALDWCAGTPSHRHYGERSSREGRILGLELWLRFLCSAPIRTDQQPRNSKLQSAASPPTSFLCPPADFPRTRWRQCGTPQQVNAAVPAAARRSHLMGNGCVRPEPRFNMSCLLPREFVGASSHGSDPFFGTDCIHSFVYTFYC